MKEFLQRIRLIDHLTTDLPISRNEFYEKLSMVTSSSDLGLFSDPFEAFSSNQNMLKGSVTYDGFRLKKRKKLFSSANMAIATGTVKEHNGRITIDAEINGFSNIFFIFYGFLLIFYSFFIATFFRGGIGREAVIYFFYINI